MNGRYTLMILASALAACSGGTEPGDDPFADSPYDVVACEGVSLATTSGVPMDRVAVTGIPSTFTLPVAGQVRTPDHALESYTFSEVAAVGAVNMAVPLHPAGDPQGGEVLIRITDGTVACPPFQFTILPLPASPGELGAIVDELQGILSAQAAFFETTTEALVATPFPDIDRVLLPLAIVQWVVDHPDNDMSLRRIADGAGGSDVPVDLLESLLARTGLRDGLASRAEPIGAPARRPSLASLGTLTCTPDAIRMTETLILSDCMNVQAEAAATLAGWANPLLPDIENTMWMLETYPGNAGVIAGWLATIHWIMMNSQERLVALLPCCIAELPVEASPIYFEEDHPGTGTWYASVIAVNQGWDLGREIIEAALTAAGASAALENVDVGGPEFESYIEPIMSGPIADFLLSDGTLEDFIIPIESFGPVPIFDPQWSKFSYSGPAIDSISHNTYEPKEPGRVTLQVTTRPDAEPPQFGRVLGVGFQDIEVDSIRLRIEPADTFMRVGDSKAFRITVGDAYFPDSIRVVAAVGAVADPEGSGGTYEVLYTPPPDADPWRPDRLVVTHIGSENGPPREAEAIIRFAGVRIVPVPLCIEVGEPPLQLEVEVPPGQSPQVNWSVTAGSISQTGLFTLPSQAQVVTVTAAWADDPEVKDTLDLTIGGCTCEATVLVSGADAGATRSMSFLLTDDLAHLRDLQWNTSAGPEASVAYVFHFGADPDAELPGTLPIGTTGTFPAWVNGVFRGVTYGNLGSETELSPIAVTIERNDGSVLSGSVSGSVELWDPSPEDPQVVPFSWTFLIEADPDLSTATSRMCRVD